MKKSCYSILALAALYLAGCGSSGSGSGGGGGNNATLVASWHEISLRQDGGATVNCPGTVDLGGGNTDTCGANDAATFSSTGNITLSDAGGTQSGTYSLSGNNLTLTINVKNGAVLSPPKVETAHITVSPTTLTVRPLKNGVEDGETLTFNKTA